MGQRPAQHTQAADRQLGNAPGVVPHKIAAALPQYGTGTARDGVGNVAAAINLCAGPGDKQVARSQLAAVFTDPARLNAKYGELLKQRCGAVNFRGKAFKPLNVRAHNAPFPAAVPCATCTGASWGMPRVRSAPLITLENTGPATSPP